MIPPPNSQMDSNTSDAMITPPPLSPFQSIPVVHQLTRSTINSAKLTTWTITPVRVLPKIYIRIAITKLTTATMTMMAMALPFSPSTP